ncbi:putative hydro-lyase [Amycolatopsis sp. CA-230715]|uniref:putative hydro-lyase n=1 Tax=Amycolatopsis sp. CA-230715 TaxID=2745196 RepID=UPI001C32AB64|nr:putative hydro-lyase [Amycolatopsis sp. CA-230715]QWF78100.1 Putative hydro-lyase [Amycolatopsis sp. CA-230715]
MTTFDDTATVHPARARALFRSGVSEPTTGWASGYAQANLIAVPRDWADDLLLFCQRNPKPCPVLDVSEPGATTTKLADGADLRTDLPRYRLWENGELVRETTDATPFWREDLVTFLIGCSFTFETALAAAGIPLRHVERGRNVAMYTTTKQCRPAGRLHGPLVVSMRQIPAALVDEAVRVTSSMPAVHGSPVHSGNPRALGIEDLARPDFGDAVVAEPGDVPVFWACGVTPQAALMASRPPFAITHAPGHMFISDRRDTEYRVGS